MPINTKHNFKRTLLKDEVENNHHKESDGDRSLYTPTNDGLSVGIEFENKLPATEST